MLETAICLNEKICSFSMAGSSDGTRVLLSTDGIWFWSTDRMTGVLSTSSSSRSGGPLNTPIINVSSCSINFCCCLLIWCKYLTVSVDDAMQESMEQLEKSLNSPCGLHEVWWSGENPWTSDGDGNGKNLHEKRWSGVNAWTCDSDRIGENLCAFYFSKQTPTVFLNDNLLAKIASGEWLIKRDDKKLS